MDCREFERRLDEAIAEDAPASLRRAAGEHMDRCESCRELAEIARASLGVDIVGAGIVGSVMERTTGSPCSPARELLAAGAAGIDATQRRLLDMHCRRCAACRELEVTLAWLEGTLRGMAEVRPDPAFLRDVLRATSSRPRPSASLAARLGDWLGLTIRRPRFALEAAYVGAVVLWLVFGTAVSPLRGFPIQALEIVQAGSSEVLQASMGPMTDALAIPASASRWAWEMTAGRLPDRVEADESRWSRIDAHARSLTLHALKAVGRATAGRFEESRDHLRLMTIDLRSIWMELSNNTTTQPDLQTRKSYQSQEA